MTIFSLVGLVLIALIIRAIIKIQKPNTELTEEQKALRYAKYFYLDMVKPDQTQIDLVEKGAINSADALTRADINTLLDAGYHKVETGYCKMPDGGGYIANLTNRNKDKYGEGLKAVSNFP